MAAGAIGGGAIMGGAMVTESIDATENGGSRKP